MEYSGNTKKEEEFDKDGKLIKTTVVNEAGVKKSKFNKAAEWIDLIVKSASLFTIALALFTYFDSVQENKIKARQAEEQKVLDSLNIVYSHLRDSKNDSFNEQKFRYEQFVFDTTFKTEQLKFLNQQTHETRRQADEQARFNTALVTQITEAEKARHEERKDHIASLQFEQFLKLIQSVNSILAYEYGSQEYISEKNKIHGAESGGILLLDDTVVTRELDKFKKQIEFYELFSESIILSHQLRNADNSYITNTNIKLLSGDKFNKGVDDSLHYSLNRAQGLIVKLSKISVEMKNIQTKFPDYFTPEKLESKNYLVSSVHSDLDSIINNSTTVLDSSGELLFQDILLTKKDKAMRGKLLLSLNRYYFVYLKPIDKNILRLQENLNTEIAFLQDNNKDIAKAMTNSNLYLKLKKATNY